MTRRTQSSQSNTGGESGAVLVTPVVRGIRLLEYIAQGGSTANLSEAGRLIDVNRVTVTRLLATLEQEGMIERLPSGGHQVSLRFLALSADTLGRHDFMTIARRHAKELCQQLGVSVYLTVLDGTDLVYLQREMPPAGLVSHVTLGSRVPAWHVAPGKAILATWAEPQLQAWIQNYPAVAVPSFQTLSEMLQPLRLQAYVWSYSGLETGINACAAAIKNPHGKTMAALSVVGPTHVFKEEAMLAERAQTAVCEAAAQLSGIQLADEANFF